MLTLICPSRALEGIPMPTENRSSNIELSKIGTEALVCMLSGVTGVKPPADQHLPGFIQGPIDRADERVAALLTQAAPQHQGEPTHWAAPTGKRITAT